MLLEANIKTILLFTLNEYALSELANLICENETLQSCIYLLLVSSQFCKIG